MKNISKLTTLNLLIGICVLAGALALLTHYIPLKDIPVLREYVDISIWLTTSGQIATGSSFTDSASVYYSFAWLMVPLFFILWWKLGKAYDGKYDTLLFVPVAQLTIWKRFTLIILTPLWAGIGVAGWYAFDGGDARLVKVGSSLAVLVCFGWIAPGAIAGTAFLFVASLKKAFFGKI